MLVTEVFVTVTLRAKIKGVFAAFVAVNASEKQTRDENTAPITERPTAFNDIVKCEEFVEIETSVSVAVKCLKNAIIFHIPRALPSEDVEKLRPVYGSVSIRI